MIDLLFSICSEILDLTINWLGQNGEVHLFMRSWFRVSLVNIKRYTQTEGMEEFLWL